MRRTATVHGAILEALSGPQAFARDEDQIAIELRLRIKLDGPVERGSFRCEKR